MFDVKSFDKAKFESILARGLSSGLGTQGGRVCIEAAICETLGLPHGDDPGCVAESVRRFKIRLNDSTWSSSEARAAGLHDLGLAQLGSRGIVDDTEFAARLAEKTIRVLLPKLFRGFKDPQMLAAADRCEKEGSVEAAWAAARAAATAARGARGAWSAAWAATWAASAAWSEAAWGATGDDFLRLSATLALEVLRELKSPGVELLDG